MTLVDFLDSEFSQERFKAISTKLSSEGFQTIAEDLIAFVKGLLEFQRTRKFRIPTRLFWNLDINGPIYILLRVCVFNLSNQFQSGIWQNEELESHLLNLLNLILNDLEQAGFWSRPAIFISNSISFAERESFTQKIDQLGGLVSKYASASHVINSGLDFDIPENDAKDQIIIQTIGAMVQIHTRFTPTSADNWIQSDKSQTLRSYDRKSNTLWYVDRRWLIESLAKMEWMNELDYDVSGSIKNVIFSDGEDSLSQASSKEADSIDDDPEYVDEDGEQDADDQDSIFELNSASIPESPIEAAVEELEDTVSVLKSQPTTLLPGVTTATIVNLDRKLPMKFKRHEFEPIWNGTLELIKDELEIVEFDPELPLLDGPPYTDNENVVVSMLENNHGPIALEDYDHIRKYVFSAYSKDQKFRPTWGFLRKVSPESDLHLLSTILHILLREDIYLGITGSKPSADPIDRKQIELKLPAKTNHCYLCNQLAIGNNYRLKANPSIILCPRCFECGIFPSEWSSKDFFLHTGINFVQEMERSQWNHADHAKLLELVENGMSWGNIAQTMNFPESECITEFLSLSIPEQPVELDMIEKLIGQPANPVTMIISLLFSAVHPAIGSEAARIALCRLLQLKEEELESNLWPVAKLSFENALAKANDIYQVESKNVNVMIDELNKLLLKRISNKLELLENFNGPNNLRFQQAILSRMVGHMIKPDGVRRKPAAGGRTIYQKELQQIRDICALLKQNSISQSQEFTLRKKEDFLDLKARTDQSKRDDELLLLRTETSMSVINISSRKQLLRKGFFNRMLDEKELTNMMQAHKDEFTQFIWKRRVQTKRDLREIFQSGPGIIGRFGDIISESTFESIQAFERLNSFKLCNDAILSSYCEKEDIPAYFKQSVTINVTKVLLQNHLRSKRVKVAQNRLEFEAIGDGKAWSTVSSTAGPWAVRLANRSLIRQLVGEALRNLKASGNSPFEYNYIPIIARMIDFLHPTHQLQATVLAYPLFGSHLLKRRLQVLGYDLGANNEDQMTLDLRLSIDILKQMQKRLEKEMRVYYEFTVPSKTSWAVGFISPIKSTLANDFGRPGDEKNSVGLCSNSVLVYNGVEHPFQSFASTPATPNDPTRTYGILVDLYHGTVSLVCDSLILPVLFGNGANAFAIEDQERQKQLILKHQMIPVFSILFQESEEPSEKCQMSINFGQKAFVNSVNATPLTYFHNVRQSKGVESISILENSTNVKDKIAQEEDEKINSSLEKNYFRVSLLPEVLKSFSQFPPSVYRRSLAATKIQRGFQQLTPAWRIYQGRQMRKRIRKEQYAAASIIQRMARKKLRKIRETKNLAAAKIQRVWRKKMLIWLALLRCIYRHTISDLHAAATIIQRKWRSWHMFKNSPLAAKYQRKMEDLEKAVNTIIKWWRPLYAQLKDIRTNRTKTHSAITIQRVFRGYRLRKMLRPDLQVKLSKIGKEVAAKRHFLLRICAAFVIQRFWRKFKVRQIRTRKTRTRNMAATKIQAIWKGFWARSSEIIANKTAPCDLATERLCF